MFTRKAAVGFILLAVIVFPVAYLSWTPIPVLTMKGYRPPIVSFDSPVEMACAVTLIIEAFTLLCYLALKRLEPYIIEWEEMERERIQDEKDEQS